MTMALTPSPKKILWVLVCIFLLFSGIVGIAGYFFFQKEERTIKQGKREILGAIADLKVNQIVTWRKERMGDANTVTERKETENVLEKNLNKIRRILR
jgi:hypothetical protein